MVKVVENSVDETDTKSKVSDSLRTRTALCCGYWKAEMVCCSSTKTLRLLSRSRDRLSSLVASKQWPFAGCELYECLN